MTFTGDHATVTIGDHRYHVTWTVYMINNSHLEKMHLSNTSYSLIYTNYQNSAILKANNSFVRVAEIFSFGSAIDARVAVKNLMKGNGHVNFTRKFQVTTKLRSSDLWNENPWDGAKCVIVFIFLIVFYTLNYMYYRSIIL